MGCETVGAAFGVALVAGFKFGYASTKGVEHYYAPRHQAGASSGHYTKTGDLSAARRDDTY